MSFSDWGKRQQSDWKTASSTDSFPTADAYTGHHLLDQHKLVHVGGRVYDPAIGRFMSADLFVQSPYSSQSFNRYSYVANNPLSRIDPTGYQDIPLNIEITACRLCDMFSSSMNNAYSSLYSNALGSGSLGNMGGGSGTFSPTPQQQLDTLAEKAGGKQNEDGSWDITDKKGNIERYRIGDKNGNGLGLKPDTEQKRLTRNRQLVEEARPTLNPFKIIKNEGRNWWKDDQTSDLREGVRLTIDVGAIPLRALRGLSDGLSAVDIYKNAKSGQYAEAIIGVMSFLGGEGASYFMKNFTLNDPFIRTVGTSVSYSTSEILIQDCYTCK